MEEDPNKTIEILKPCRRCGCEIHPLKTDYTKMRIQCNTCNEIVIRQRINENNMKRRILSRKLQLEKERDTCILPRCVLCKSKLPKGKSAYCSKQCSVDGKRLNELIFLIEKAKIRVDKEKKTLRKYQRHKQKILESIEAKRQVIEPTLEI